MIERMWGHLKRIPIRGHLNSPKELMSPLSLLLIAVWIPVGYLFLFNATLIDIGVYIIVDRLIVLALFKPYLGWLYRKYASYKLLVEGTYLELEKDKIDEKLILQIQRFSQRFAFQCLVVGLIKSIPGFFIVLSWNHGLTFESTLFRFLLLTLATMTQMYGMQFMELQDWSSKVLKELNEKYDLSGVFLKVKLSILEDRHIFAEAASFFSVIIPLFITQILVFYDRRSFSTHFWGTYIIFSTFSLLFLSREFYLSRTFFFNNLNGIFKSMNENSFFDEHKQLTLSSSELLAKFQQVFNKMNSDLREKISEIKNWTNYATAKTRIQTLGETSAIVAHDLAGPIHSMKLFMEELKERPNEVSRSPELIERMDVALGRCEELIYSLRSSLKNTSEQFMDERSSFKEIYSYASNSILALYRNSDELRNSALRKPKISLRYNSEDEVSDAVIHLSRLDGIHIVSNLLSNAASELIRSEIPNPYIIVELRQINSETIEIRIIDNGRGLSATEFESLTSDVGLFKGYYASVGLHLIRKMVEGRGGKIWVETPRTDGVNAGTAVVIRVSGSLIKEDRKHEERNLDS
ncbi:MAG: hypothetical protein KA715_08635 [Xanthomonadaceae bacterium]|nr:hypothetical protein [Xanthomonadaceae bacterium]